MNYIFLADGFETVEALAVVDMMFRAGIELTKVSMSDSVAVTTSHKVEIKADKIFDECDFSDADMLILPGGMPGTVNLENDDRLISLIKKHAAEGKKLSAICAAPRVLGRIGLLEGKKACCYPGNEELLKGAEVVYEPVACDGNFITSRGMGTVTQFGAAIIESLCGREKAEEILSQIQWVKA